MTAIKYIGKKPVKTDNVAGTGTVWNGPGDVQNVDKPEAVAKLLAHTGIWVREEAEAKPVALSEVTNTAPKPPETKAPTENTAGLTLAPGTTVTDAANPLAGIDTMEAPELHALAKKLGVNVHHAAGAAKVREALRAQ